MPAGGDVIMAQDVTPMGVVFAARQTTSQSTGPTDGTLTLMSWQAIDKDILGGFKTAAPTRYTAVVAGWYLLAGGASFLSNATGYRATAFRKNGTAIDGSTAQVAAVNGASTVVPSRSTSVYLAKDDWIEMTVSQSGVAGLMTNTASHQQSSWVVSFAWPVLGYE